MLRSEPILPIRFYDDLFNQTRFNKRCDEFCDTGLFFPTNGLPFFQIKRDASMNTPQSFFIRNICRDKDAKFYKSVPEGAENFQSDTTFYDPLPSDALTPQPAECTGECPIVYFDCGKMKSIYYDPNTYTGSGGFPQFTIPTSQCLTRFKIIVDKFVSTTGLEIRIYDWGIATFYAITAPGTYIYEFAPSANIVVQFAMWQPGDEFEISYIQAQQLDLSCEQYIDDVLLDETKIKVIPLADGTDRLVYCGDLTNYDIKPGDYYYFIRVGGERAGGGGGGGLPVPAAEVYFSEVFTIKSIKDIEKYYCLKWWNSCDIESQIIYDEETLECTYYNKIYLDAGLFKPEYPTVKTIEEDGQGNQTEVFKKWSKNKTLDLVAPEFLIDALSAVFINDNIYLQRPLNDAELKQHNEHKILNIEQEIVPVFNDCQQKINLKFLLQKTFTSATCCDAAELFGRGYKYEAHETCEDAYEGSGYVLQLSETPTAGDGLIKCDGETLVPVLETDIIYYHGDDKFYRLKLIDGIYTGVFLAPKITTVVEDDAAVNYIITGNLIPHTFGIIEYKVDAGDWHDSEVTTKANAEGVFICTIPKSLADDATTFQVRVHNISLEDDFGYSDAFIVI